MSNPPLQKVLVVRLGAIGDVVNALVFASALKAAYPGIELHWAVHPLAAPLVQGNPLVDRVHVWNRGQGAAEFLRLRRELRSEGFDLAVDLQRLLKSSLLARCSGARRVLGYDRGRAKECSWLLTRERIGAGDPSAHMLQQYLEFARHLQVAQPESLHVLPEDPISEAWAEGLLAELGGAPILINLGASKPLNRWPPERFGALMAALRAELAQPICLVGGPQDVAAGEQAMQACLEASQGVVHPRNLVGETSLRMLVALCRRAALFVGCDTGPMHIAGAVGCPVVALFGPADERRTGPYFDQSFVVRSPLRCSACEAGRRQGHTCMQAIQVSEVSAMALRRLAGASPTIPGDAGAP